MTRWRCVDREPPDSPGVYAVFAPNGSVGYVGASSNLRSRLTQGHPVAFALCEVRVRTTHNAAAAFALERRLIERLKPQANRSGKAPRQKLQIIGTCVCGANATHGLRAVALCATCSRVWNRVSRNQAFNPATRKYEDLGTLLRDCETASRPARWVEYRAEALADTERDYGVIIKVLKSILPPRFPLALLPRSVKPWMSTCHKCQAPAAIIARWYSDVGFTPYCRACYLLFMDGHSPFIEASWLPGQS